MYSRKEEHIDEIISRIHNGLVLNDSEKHIVERALRESNNILIKPHCEVTYYDEYGIPHRTETSNINIIDNGDTVTLDMHFRYTFLK